MTDEDQFSYGEERAQYALELTNVLDGAVQEYADNRTAYFQEIVGDARPELTWLFNSTEAFAGSLLKEAGNLVSDDWGGAEHAHFLDEYYAKRKEKLQEQRAKLQSFPPEVRQNLWSMLRDVLHVDLEQDSPARLVWERLCIELAEDSIGRIEYGAFRLLDLWGLMIRAKPCPASEQFLQRVSRCYVWGFYSECIILCRSVLDATFRELQPEVQTLHKRIDSVAKDGLISPKAKQAAHSVRHCGNKAVHYEPNFQADALEVIRNTLCVIEEIPG